MDVLAINARLATTVIPPSGFRDIFNNEEFQTEWIEATNTEVRSLLDNDVFEEVKITDLPPETCIVHGRFIYKIKAKEDGTIGIFKARLIIRGDLTKAGIHYDPNTFAPVASATTIRLVLAIAATLGLHLRDIDFKTAYLNAKRNNDDKPIYMRPPEGSRVRPGYVWLVKRALYGLPDSARLWNKELVHTVLNDAKFTQSKYDPCLFYKISKNEITLVTLVVDDMLIASNSKRHADKFVKILQQKYKLKDMGQAKYTLGIHIDYDRENNTLKLNQNLYLKNTIKKYRQGKANANKTPADKGSKLRKELPGRQYEGDYRALVGSLLYAVQTRPDIATIVSDLSRYFDCANSAHYKAGLRVLRYLRGTIDYSLLYKPQIQKQGEIEVFVDAAHNYCPDTRRSRTGYCVTFNRCLIMWRSTMQPIVTLSSTEAEYVALTEAVKEAIWMKNMVTQLGFKQGPVRVYIDNRGAIEMANNPKINLRTKHIDLRFHWIREQIERKQVVLLHIAGVDNLADILTKIVGAPRQQHLLQGYMV